MKILVLAGLDLSLINFRGSLLHALIEAGHQVIGAAPSETPTVPQQLAAMGVRFVPVSLTRAGLNPLADFRTRRGLEKLFRTERPDVVLAYTIKPVIYGTLAAKRAGVPHRFALITGLGAAFHTPGLKGRLLSLVATGLYRRALQHCERVLVQNSDIAEFFIKRGIVKDPSRITVVPGSGVDTQHFNAMPMPSGPPAFLLLARMLRDKGVEEYVAAARLVKSEMPQARFLLVGDTDPNLAVISAQQLSQWNQEGVVEYHSAVADVRPLLSACSVYVLPSYHEGMPRSVLESMATARPVITTDTIGCRDTIFGADRAGPPRDVFRIGDNGLLVPVRDGRALAAAMRHMIRHPQLAESMGRNGRELAAKPFDVRTITSLMIRALELEPAGGMTVPPSLSVAT